MHVVMLHFFQKLFCPYREIFSRDQAFLISIEAFCELFGLGGSIS